jgi:molybdopterin biosynthesis enzyme
MQGVKAVHRAPAKVRLDQMVKGASGVTRLLRATLAPYGGGFDARLTGPQGSGLMSAMAHADALLLIPEGDDLPAGSIVAAIPLRGAVAMDTVLRIGP